MFTDWIKKTLPDRADKVLHQIENCHRGLLNDSRFGIRMRGQGQMDKQINNSVKLVKHIYFKNKATPKLNNESHKQYKDGQLRLF